MERFYSNGKLLLTAEYVVLDGVSALAIPTTFGQSLEVEKAKNKSSWKSIDHQGNVWFQSKFSLDNDIIIFEEDNTTANTLVKILNAAKELNPEFLLDSTNLDITTKLDFPNDWGLGSSSTLINNIADWAHIDAYKLLEMTFGGSGYDIACAQYDHPVLYQLKDGKPIVQLPDFYPSFTEHLYFVHLNKKQNSREGVAQYERYRKSVEEALSIINHITSKLITCNNLEEFNELITLHEQTIGNIIKQKPVKELFFNDFNGAIKSLGAWGGDFILVSSKTSPEAYFKEKGFHTIISYNDMIL